MNKSDNHTPVADEIHLLQYLIVLAKNGRMIIYVSIAVMFLTYLILFLLPNKYTATANLLPPQQNMTLSGQVLESLEGSSLLLKENAMGGSLSAMMGLKSPADLYVGILKSDAILDPIIDCFKLRKLYDERYIEDVRKKLKKWAEITSNKEGIIDIAVTDEDPRRAANMANAFIGELDKLLQKIAVREAVSRAAFLETTRAQTLVRLKKAEEELRTFSEKHSILAIEAQTRGVLEYIASLRASIDAREVQREVLRQKATPLNDEAIMLETEIKGLKEKLHECEKTDGKNLCGTSMIATSSAPALALEYMRLYREVLFQEKLYQLYCKLFELARMDEVRHTSVVQIINSAKPPEKRSNLRLLPSLVAGISAFFLMVVIAFMSEYYRGLLADERTCRLLAVLNDYLAPFFKLPKRFLSMFRKKKD